MTYDQLAAFLAVAAEGSFTAASERLHKSQPAVSKLVRNLEADLGLDLFDRGAYRATLTDAGRLFHERALAVAEGTEALASFARELAGVAEPIVRLAIEAVTPLAPVLEVLRRVRERHPAVRIELRSERLAGAGEALREGRADLVLGTKLGLGSLRVEAARFTDVRVIPVAHREHPLARVRRPVPPALFRAHAQIVLRDSARDEESPSLNVLEGGLRWTVTDVAQKHEIIAAGMGWGGLPGHVVAGALARGELVALDVPEFEAEVMELFLLRRRDRARGVVAQALWEGLRGVATTSAAPAPRRPRGGRRSVRRLR